jgi:predicted DNA-binding transcriptional regulator YafY
MRRAERLFRLVQFLRAAGRPKTAADIGAALEVSRRTVYRDIAHLQGSGLPIDGEAGIGYILRPGFDLPPMTFTREQVEALALGARLVGAVGDAEIAAAAREVLSKLAAVLPPDAARLLSQAPLYAFARRGTDTSSLPELRRAIRQKSRIRARYLSVGGEASERTLRPLALACFGPVWLLSAWCELREDFRDFRADRFVRLEVLGDRFEDEPGRSLDDYLAHRQRGDEQRTATPPG